MAPAVQQQAAPAQGDGYLEQISQESLEVLSHFGPEAPVKLNQYACQVEDALIEAIENQREQADMLGEFANYVENLQPVLAEAAWTNEAKQRLLTDPDLLSDYVEKFFGPEGPYPVQTPGEQAQTALQQGMVEQGQRLMARPEREAFQAMEPQQAQAQAQAQMPAMPLPGAGQPAVNPASYWENFSRMMEINPAEAYKLLDQGTPDVIRAKVFAINS